MTLLDWSNLIISLAGLGLGYIGAHGAVQRWHRSKKLPKLQKEKLFLAELHDSVSRQQGYLLESLMILVSIAGAGLMLCVLPPLPVGAAEPLGALRVWLFGAAVYFFSLRRLSRYWDATKRYEKVSARLDADIQSLQE